MGAVGLEIRLEPFNHSQQPRCQLSPEPGHVTDNMDSLAMWLQHDAEGQGPAWAPVLPLFPAYKKGIELKSL